VCEIAIEAVSALSQYPAVAVAIAATPAVVVTAVATVAAVAAAGCPAQQSLTEPYHQYSISATTVASCSSLAMNCVASSDVAAARLETD
jgi:hypothetical protein